MNKKIGHKGFASLLFFLSQEIFLGVGLTRILSISEQNSWISILIAFVIGFIFLKNGSSSRDQTLGIRGVNT